MNRISFDRLIPVPGKRLEPVALNEAVLAASPLFVWA